MREERQSLAGDEEEEGWSAFVCAPCKPQISA